MIAKSQSAAPRSARFEARSATYDKGRTLLHDLIPQSANMQSKGSANQTVRNSQGLMYNRRSDRTIALTRRGFEANQSAFYGIINDDQTNLVASANALKSTIQPNYKFTHLFAGRSLGNRIRINTNCLILLYNNLGGGLGLAPNLVDYQSQSATTNSFISNAQSVNATFNHLDAQINSAFTLASNELIQVFNIGFFERTPYLNRGGLGDPSSGKLEKSRDHFRLAMRPFSATFNGAIVRSGISWQQAKNDESFLRQLKYRNP